MADILSGVLAWPPLVWILRTALSALGLAAILLAALFMVRFLRVKNVKAMWNAEMPRLRRLGGNAELFGQKLALNADLDNDRDEQIRALHESVERLTEQQAGQLDMILELASGLRSIQEVE